MRLQVDLNALQVKLPIQCEASGSPICFCPQHVPHHELFSKPTGGLLDPRNFFQIE
jgi:hypothetical protein